MVSSEEYYDAIAEGYNFLHKEEQLKKLKIIFDQGIIFKDDSLLDVGCGTGFSLDFFEVKSSTGIEPSSELIKQYSGRKKIYKGFAEKLPFDDAVFDVVISITAIQNFVDVKKGLEEIRRVGTGRFALTVLKKSPKIVEIKSFFDEVFDKKEYSVFFIEEEKDIIFIIRRTTRKKE